MCAKGYISVEYVLKPKVMYTQTFLTSECQKMLEDTHLEYIILSLEIYSLVLGHK